MNIKLINFVDWIAAPDCNIQKQVMHSAIADVDCLFIAHKSVKYTCAC